MKEVMVNLIKFDRSHTRFYHLSSPSQIGSNREKEGKKKKKTSQSQSGFRSINTRNSNLMNLSIYDWILKFLIQKIETKLLFLNRHTPVSILVSCSVKHSCISLLDFVFLIDNYSLHVDTYLRNITVPKVLIGILRQT